MEPEAVLNLFDSRWFELNVLKKNSTTSSIEATSYSAKNLDHDEVKKESPEPKLARIQTSHSRSMSDQSMPTFKHGSLSPDSVLFHPKLQTILSGKEVSDSEPENPSQVMNQEVLSPKKNTTGSGIIRKKRETKSLSDLEFEELKGFMDLGFVFSEEDKDSSLASIIPGLQRLGKKDEKKEEDFDESLVPRPYLSEAWEVYDRRKKENPLMNWKVPAVNNETDMKDSLRLWAHTVASTIRCWNPAFPKLVNCNLSQREIKFHSAFQIYLIILYMDPRHYLFWQTPVMPVLYEFKGDNVFALVA